MTKEERIKEIRKAIDLLGFLEVSERIKSSEDRTIYNEIREECLASLGTNADKVLEEHNIKF